MSDLVKVSVCMVTYNHEKYIEQAVRSVLSQESQYSIELLVGDDKSKDSTPEILARLQQEFPVGLKVLDRPENLGMFKNCQSLFDAADGKYVALLDGDDYWTDPSKIEQQVSFLEENHDFTICFHNTRVVYENSDKESYLYRKYLKSDYDFDDLARLNYIHTSSVLYRNGLAGSLPDWCADVGMVDWPLFLLVAEHGKAHYIDKEMSAYRKHDSGIWMQHQKDQRFKDSITAILKFREKFGPERRKAFNKGLQTAYRYWLEHQVEYNYNDNYLGNYGELLKYSIFTGNRDWRTLWRLNPLVKAKSPA